MVETRTLRSRRGMRLPATVAIALSFAVVWCAAVVAAAPCPATGGDAPAVTTLMASKTDPATKAWVVTPNCVVETLTAAADGTLACGLRGIERVDSVPTSTTQLYLWKNPLSKGGDLTKATKLTHVEMVVTTADVLESLALPDSVAVILAGGNKIQSLNKVKFPASLETAVLLSNDLTSLKGVTFPASLTELDLNENKLTAIDFALPSKLVRLDLEKNAILTIEGNTFPDSLEFFGCSECGIRAIRGVRWPRSLQNLTLTSNPITDFEIRKSDATIFQQLRGFSHSISQSTCKDSTAVLTEIQSANLCVISDTRFNTKYRSAGGTSTTTPSGGDGSSPTSGSGSGSSMKTSKTPSSGGDGDSGSITGSSSSRLSGSGTIATTNRPLEQSPDGTILNNGGAPGATTTVVTPSSNGPNMVILIAIIIVGVIFGVLIMLIAYRVFIVPRQRARSDVTALTKFALAETPGTKTSSKVGSNPSTSQEYLSNDVRNDKELIKFRIDQKEILLSKQIARGGFGLIFKGSYQGRDVAIKQMLPGTWRDDATLIAFMSEIRLCSTLDHPKIVEFIGIAWSSLRDVSVVIEYMAGGDLHILLHKQPQPVAPRDWFEPWTANNIKSKTSIAQDIAEAVVYLHSFNSPILHRDLKARNVLLDSEGSAKLSDFGISREMSVDETMTSEIGTAAWIAPEVLRGERYSEKADIYSLGVLLVELDRCRHPYASEPALKVESSTRPRPQAGAHGTMSHVAHKNTQIAVLVSTGKLRPSMTRCCPQSIQRLTSRCLSYDPAERPTAMEVYYELRQVRKGIERGIV